MYKRSDLHTQVFVYKRHAAIYIRSSISDGVDYEFEIALNILEERVYGKRRTDKGIEGRDQGAGY